MKQEKGNILKLNIEGTDDIFKTIKINHKISFSWVQFLIMVFIILNIINYLFQ